MLYYKKGKDMGKKCNKCGEIKEVESGFSKNKLIKDGYEPTCKGCQGMRRKAAKNYVQQLSIEELSRIITYDPETGNIYKSGTFISYPSYKDSNGYTRFSIKAYTTYTHQIAWFFTHGEWARCVDHIDGDVSNNRISNLRKSTMRENMSNRKTHRDGALLGASFNAKSGKWAGRTPTIYFNTEREASLHYCKYALANGLISREFIPSIFTDAELGIIGDCNGNTSTK